jgi:hypothetical protein
MKWKKAVTVEKEELSPTPPASGEAIQPPVFPEKPEEEVPKVKKKDVVTPPKLDDKPTQEGFAPAIAEAVQEALGVLKNIVEDQLDVSESNTQDVTDIKEKINDTINELSSVTTIVKDLKSKKVPQRKEWEADQELSDSLYNQAVQIMDETLSQIDVTFPEYQYNKSSITKFDPTGNIQNGELSISVVLSNFMSKIRYHIEVPIYIFNGYIQEPETFRHEGVTYKFDPKVIEDLIAYVPSTSADMQAGAYWADQNKHPMSLVPNKVPDAPYNKQKEYRKFDQRMNPVKPKTQFWNNHGIVELNNDANNMSSPTVQYQEIDYALR